MEYSWQRISGTAAGTTVISPVSGNLKSVVIGQNKTGTVTFYDNASGTSSLLMFNLDNTIGSIPTSLSIDAHLRYGLVAVVGGTTDMTVIYN